MVSIVRPLVLERRLGMPTQFRDCVDNLLCRVALDEDVGSSSAYTTNKVFQVGVVAVLVPSPPGEGGAQSRKLVADRKRNAVDGIYRKIRQSGVISIKFRILI